MARLAVIDLGTNSVRLDIYDVDRKRSADLLHREKEMVRLGESLFSTGLLCERAIDRTINTLKEFRRAADRYGVTRIVVYGTSAMRTAKNSNLLISRAKKEACLEISIISGSEEARLILNGILHDRRTRKGSFSFIDIGGGSTEVGVCSENEVRFLHSFEIGASRLTQQCEKLRGARLLYEMRRIARETFNSFPLPACSMPKLDIALGSSGSVKAVRKILRESRGHKHIKLKSISTLIEELSELNPEEMNRMPGMNPRRTDIILGGCIILEEAMQFLNVKETRVTKFAMRDGILWRQLELLHDTPSFSLSAA